MNAPLQIVVNYLICFRFLTLISVSRKFYNSVRKFSSAESCLNETSQLILLCEFAFALLDFLVGGFSEQIKIDLFADCYNGIEIL